jgi:hypothetical protein
LQTNDRVALNISSQLSDGDLVVPQESEQSASVAAPAQSEADISPTKKIPDLAAVAPSEH